MATTTPPPKREKLSARTADIDLTSPSPAVRVFNGQTPPPAHQARASTVPVALPSRAPTGVGMVMGALAGRDELSQKLKAAEDELKDAKVRLDDFAGANASKPIDPKLIIRSRWANRDIAEFTTDSFKEFRNEIRAAGGNVQPIQARLIPGRVFNGKTPHLELVYGHRRHQACLEEGIPVNTVVINEMDDRELFARMDRENRGRKNLSAWEQGKMYSDALTDGLFTSIRHLSTELTVNLSIVSRAIQLAKLPTEVVAAFQTPLDLQYRWAKPLSDALQSDPEGVLARARALTALVPRLPASDVFAKLIEKGSRAGADEIQISIAGAKAAVLRKAPKGRAVVEFDSGILTEERHAALAKLIEDFLASN